VERSSYRYEPQPDRNLALREELVKLARQKPRYGYRRLHALLERRGHEVNDLLPWIRTYASMISDLREGADEQEQAY